MIRAASVFFLLFASTAALAGTWQAFRDPAGAFTVDVPTAPAVSSAAKTADGKTIPIAQYAVGRPKGALIVTVSDFTTFNIVAAKALDGAAASLKSNAAQTLSDTAVTVDGQKGRNVSVIDKSGHQVSDRIFFVKKKLYQILSVHSAKSDVVTEAEAKRFQTSFHFTKH